MFRKLIQRIRNWWNKSKKLENSEPPLPQPTTQKQQNLPEKITKIQEELIRQQFLSAPPKIYRRRIRNRPPPAEQHRNAISKFMKGKGRFSSWYRKQIKRSQYIKIKELEN